MLQTSPALAVRASQPPQDGRQQQQQVAQRQARGARSKRHSGSSSRSRRGWRLAQGLAQQQQQLGVRSSMVWTLLLQLSRQTRT